ncbi:cyclic nucleotide-binding-like protein [Dipodascopsis tothii]|uniref:cyclic nucleotide-binding-like protein n=1 Tax=Dipodascopsis tothii TaxID=44089 RepID=UPI0034CF9CCE
MSSPRSTTPAGDSVGPLMGAPQPGRLSVLQPNSGLTRGEFEFPENFNKGRRSSVSGESLSPAGLTTNGWRPRKIAKTPEQMERLNRSVAKSFLLSTLDEEAIDTVLNALEEKRVAANVTVIQQGDEGEKFYIIESGSFDCYVSGTLVSTVGPGGSFGELALMYNAPRAATVVSTVPSVLWTLDGTTFRRILLDRTAKQRTMYEQFLSEVPVLQQLTSWERAKIADALKAVSFDEGEIIIREGDVGEEFFLVESGTAEIEKQGEGKVMDIKKGDYFGELALLNDAPRAATVRATSKIRLVKLDKSGFRRLLGQVSLKRE